ncbi:glycosyltransferase family 2 protein [Echinicola jeungdonensis]|uniref:Glycosyltransferase family 2 protein n=1 Tax=Echinicola jeungdonensis TaxID=709343 RepID=A0ABV5J8L0_9BACT|nr:glycosyltransferase family 2 protein [Echinicola jeungdonensis]MDN3668051.1 glycosyltransferase family 2 protein [Echinicola jeungdonensis]
MQKAAIVILNYNGKEMLQKFLPNVIKNSHFEIIIADNASTDESVHFLKEHYPKIRTVLLEKNHGFSKGYNLALQSLKGEFEYYILLNSDVEVSPFWDLTLVQWLEEHPDFAAVQPKILSHQFPGKFDYAGAAGGFIDTLGYPYCRGRVLHTLEKDQGQYDEMMEVDWVSGACFVVRSSLFHQEGGFDDIFFAHMEEIDLCWRFSRLGYKLGCIGNTSVFHVGGGTLSRSSPFKTYLNFRNNLLMLYKNLTPSSFFKITLARIFLDAGAAVHFLIQGEWAHSKAVLNAYRDFLKFKGRINKKAPLASKLPFRKIGKKIPSVIWVYYLKGNKKFGDI